MTFATLIYTTIFFFFFFLHCSTASGQFDDGRTRSSCSMRDDHNVPFFLSLAFFPSLCSSLLIKTSAHLNTIWYIRMVMQLYTFISENHGLDGLIATFRRFILILDFFFFFIYSECVLLIVTLATNSSSNGIRTNWCSLLKKFNDINNCLWTYLPDI